MSVEFKAWPKIKRGSPLSVTITEKIDGTNACIIIQDGEIVGVQSRKRMITVENDNYGFALWVEENKEELLGLGDGYHYGEWAGEGIQKNPYNIDHKALFLFNTMRWNPKNPNLPECCSVVPVLYEGELKEDTIDNLLKALVLEADGNNPEGVIVYYHTLRDYSKHTIQNQQGKWRELAKIIKE